MNVQKVAEVAIAKFVTGLISSPGSLRAVADQAVMQALDECDVTREELVAAVAGQLGVKVTTTDDTEVKALLGQVRNDLRAVEAVLARAVA